ncbi:MAG: septum formation initiator family protein [Anaerococcus sp.]|nr:septum formation initiator family protein [Anaerococcus sp.]
MNKYERYLKNRSKKNKRFLMMCIFAFVLVFLLAKSFNNKINAQIGTVNNDIKLTSGKISSLRKDIDSIKEDYENRNTDEYKEKVAREKLGMIKKDEYVYKDENNK